MGVQVHVALPLVPRGSSWGRSGSPGGLSSVSPAENGTVTMTVRAICSLALTSDAQHPQPPAQQKRMDAIAMGMHMSLEQVARFVPQILTPEKLKEVDEALAGAANDQ